MPVAVNSPARNFFLIASSGQQEITSFIRRISTSSLSDTYAYEPSKVEFVITDQKYLLGGSQLDSTDSLYEGFLVKANELGQTTYNNKLQSTRNDVSLGVSIRGFAQDSVEEVIVCGRIGLSGNGGAPYVGKFDFDGRALWFQSTTETFGNSLIEYADISIDSNDNIYVIGYATPNAGLPNNSTLSKYLSDGTILWSKKLLDEGSDGFGDFKYRNVNINSRNELIVTGSLEGTLRTKGVVSKYDLFGNNIWTKTFENTDYITENSYNNVIINASYVDGNDFIYCAGYSENQVTGEYYGVVFRLSPEGNILWQRKTNYANNIQYTSVSADTLTGQVLVAGEVWTGSSGFTVTQRFSDSGDLVWTRKLSSSNARSAFVDVTTDPSYYYIVYADETQQASDPETFLYGRLSITGNGLGTFDYNDGVLDQNYSVINLPITTGTLSDGSLRNDNSDFITYPYNGVKVLFDDLTMIYQPKQPVHDGSDHEIVSQNVLSEPQTIKISVDGIVYDSNLLLNYDFGNIATYDRAENLATWSEDFNNSAWKTNSDYSVEVDSSVAVAPDGTTTADYIYKTNPTNAYTGLIRQFDGLTSNTTYTFSFYHKAKERDIGGLFALEPGGFSLVQTLTKITIDIGGGWKRTYASINIGSRTAIRFKVELATGSLWTGTQGYYLWGGQLEKGSTAGRYIKTSGTAITAPTTVKNLSSSSYTGTINGATFNSAGYFEFDGNPLPDQYINAGDIDVASSISLEAWIKGDVDADGSGAIMRVINKDGSYLLQYDSTADQYQSTIILDVGSGFVGVPNSVNLLANTWYHLLGTYDGSDLKIYTNGVETGSIALTGSLVQNNNSVEIGASTTQAYDYDGSIAEVRIYNRGLTATEVSQNFNATRSKYGV